MTSPDDKTLDRCARAYYESLYRGVPVTPWELLDAPMQSRFHQAARACIGALLPVSQKILDAMEETDTDAARYSGYATLHADGETVFTAAITAVLKGEV